MSSLKFEGMGSISGRDLKKLLLSLMGDSDEESSQNRKVKKSIPAKKEWIKIHDDSIREAKKIEAELVAIKNRMEGLDVERKKMWAMIELGLDDFTTDKRYNAETKEIEILADLDNKKVEKGQPIPSPFQESKK